MKKPIVKPIGKFVWEEEDLEWETGVEEGSAKSGWYGPPKGDHTGEEQHNYVRGKSMSLFDTDTWKEYQGTDKIEKGTEFMESLIKEQGFDGKPTVVTSSEMDKLIDEGHKPLYRGVTAISKESDSSEYFNSFKDGDLFVGGGIDGQGTYVAYDKKYAQEYAKGIWYGRGITMKMTLMKDARIISINELKKTVEGKVPNLSQSLFRQAMKASKIGNDAECDRLMDLHYKQKSKETNMSSAIRQDWNRMAVSLGYDAVDFSHNYMIILNRTALYVQDSPVPEVS